MSFAKSAFTPEAGADEIECAAWLRRAPPICPSISQLERLVQMIFGKMESQTTSDTVESNVVSDIVEATSGSSQWCSLARI
jgi:hypothetical protein